MRASYDGDMRAESMTAHPSIRIPVAKGTRRGPMAAQMAPEAPTTGGDTAVLDRELEKLLNEEQLDDGDHDRFSHYVKKEKILESAVTGKPVRALCGKKWRPNANPDRFPVCPTCKEIYEKVLRD